MWHLLSTAVSSVYLDVLFFGGEPGAIAGKSQPSEPEVRNEDQGHGPQGHPHRLTPFSSGDRIGVRHLKPHIFPLVQQITFLIKECSFKFWENKAMHRESRTLMTWCW